MNKFLFIGDSLIQYYNWQNRFPDRKIINSGMAGETAEGLFARLPEVMSRVESPDMVMIMTGINNVAMEDYGFLYTYEKIIASLRQAYRHSVLVMASLLPVDLIYIADAILRVNAILKETAQKHNIVFLDLYPLFLDDNDQPVKAYFEPDGVHLSILGYEVWAKAIEDTFSLQND
jgi:lysophospholipase L1-like esterase